MPIDDALENIPKEASAKKEGTPDPSCTLYETIFSSYFVALEKETRDNYGGTIHASELKQCAGFVRFTPQGNLVFGPMPRDVVITMVYEKDKTLGELLKKTDLGEFIREPFYLTKKEHYESIPAVISIKEHLKITTAEQIETKSKNYLIIPDFDFLSLFVEEGETLRNYGRVIKTSLPLMKFNEKMVASKEHVFTANALKKFFDETGTRELKKMVEHVMDFEKAIEPYTRWQPDNMSVRTVLMQRLQKYHPDLIMTGG